MPDHKQLVEQLRWGTEDGKKRALRRRNIEAVMAELKLLERAITRWEEAMRLLIPRDHLDA